MKKPNPDHIEKLCSIINKSPYPSFLSIKMADIGIGYSVTEVEIEQKHTQLRGIVHGGLFASLIDIATFWAVYYEIEDPYAWLTSVDLKLNYLASESSGKLIAKGRRIRVGKSLCYADAEIRNEAGRLLTHGSSTLKILRDSELAKSIGFPAKFID
ncbi:PaaI family thioesterase [Desulfococcaceae bacterium HSG8]|nr:PaaI family thioesterase [Desulfococcaceae bacterium HSG8]